MSKVSDFSVGLLHEFALEAVKAGFTPENVASLKEPLLRTLRQVLLGNASINVHSHIIDCDADSALIRDWVADDHVLGGKFEWDPTKVELRKPRDVVVTELREELASQRPLNANVLDYLLANLQLIPEGWKGRQIYFLGTVYRDIGGCRYVRYLYWLEGKWRWLYGSVTDRCLTMNPVVAIGTYEPR